MEISQLKPRRALNKAFLKVKPNRAAIEDFKANLILLLDRSISDESEEFHKNLLINFLKKTYYDRAHFVNTKGRNDLVIHNGDKAKSTVGVIIEAKGGFERCKDISSYMENCFQKHSQKVLRLYEILSRCTVGIASCNSVLKIRGFV